ncbi:SLAP domain-containing protein [Peribacillus sp. SCS-37]|uniref:SLAP domain-containing protein n=1 Tax=Paraperibacillus esterisolvens TaxID=3115296 RepID=UPI003905A326
MQQLQFEASWDKAIAAADRENIERIFNETKHQQRSGILFSPVREAINHREALLVTVLVHNFTDEAFRFDGVKLRYSVGGKAVGEDDFTLPLEIPSGVSMPWTFIFPRGSYTPVAAFQNGELEII